MTVTLLYNPGGPEWREIDHLKEQLARVHIPLQEVEADSRQGAAMTELYDAMQRPCLLVTTDRGDLVQKWEGTLPQPQEVSSLVAPR